MKRILQVLFGEPRKVKLEEIREALKTVERDRRKARREVRKWDRKRRQLLDKMKSARADGNKMEVDYLWEDFKHQKTIGRDLMREARIYNIEGTALKRYLRVLERLERKKDVGSSQKLLERIARSGLVERAVLEREDEVRYLEEVSTILEDFDGLEEEEREDPEKALFLAELDSIQRAEESGDEEEARERQDELLGRYAEPDPEDPA